MTKLVTNLAVKTLPVLKCQLEISNHFTKFENSVALGTFDFSRRRQITQLSCQSSHTLRQNTQMSASEYPSWASKYPNVRVKVPNS
jgi:hypothetical protein